MSDDWLDTNETVPALPIPVELPASYAERAALAEASWGRLTPAQKTFLSAWRDCRYNARAASRQLGMSENTKPHTRWMNESDYALVVKVWRANVAANARDQDVRLAKHEEILDIALTPRPVFHQGAPVIGLDGKPYEEVDVGTARATNVDLMKVAGLFPKEGAEINVGVAFTPVKVEIEQPAGDVTDAAYEVVEASPVLPLEEDWLA